jgi:hypothetical protein
MLLHSIKMNPKKSYLYDIKCQNTAISGASVDMTPEIRTLAVLVLLKTETQYKSGMTSSVLECIHFMKHFNLFKSIRENLKILLRIPSCAFCQSIHENNICSQS